MRLVVADTGPLHYLVLISHIEILPMLFETVFIPSVVCDELAHAEAPTVVQEWIMHPPAWLEVRDVITADYNDPAWLVLDEGERAAITLATCLAADLMLMDDRTGSKVARQKGFVVTGTLGILDLAARRGFIDLAKAFDRLKATNFRYPSALQIAESRSH
jgi:predicted nucleic acid-binding protein